MVKRRKSVLILAFAVILSFISASRLSACNVTQAHIWAGKTPTDAVKVHSPTTPVYILKGSTAYFYGEATANPDPQHRQLKWTYTYGDGGSDIHYTAYDATSDTASHTYTSTGAYTITLTVERKDLVNSSASNTCKVTVITIDILQNSNVITNTTHDEIVGKQINLSGQVQPSGLTISNPQWSIPGKLIAQEVYNDTTGTETDITTTDLTKAYPSAISFYWGDGGDGRTIQYSVTVNGTVYTPSATINVKRPTATITTSTDSVYVDTDYYNHSGWWLHYGNKVPLPGIAGITFTDTIVCPEVNGNTATGTQEWIQIVNLEDCTIQDTSGATWKWEESSGVDTGLDTSYPYDTANPTRDSPGEPLNPWNSGFQNASDSMNCQMYLMWQPTGSGSIYVPLSVVTWSWSGSTSSSNGGSTWSSPPTNPSNTVNPTGSDTTTFPTWTTNVANDTWVKQ